MDKNITSAIERGTNKPKEVTSDLSKFFSISKPPPRPRNRLIASFEKKLKEKSTAIRNRLQQNIANLLIGLKR